jgi:FK506-binding nuclear protein
LVYFSFYVLIVGFERVIFLEQSPENDLSPFGSEMGSDDEDDFDLRDVSSDVEMHPDDLAGVDSDAR